MGTSGPWTSWPTGIRVVVRRRLPEGGFGDVLGDVVVSSPDRLVVRTRRGDVAVDPADVVLGKPVPPPPPRRAPRAAPRGPGTPDGA